MKRLLIAVLCVCVTWIQVAAQSGRQPQVQTPPVYRGDTATQPDKQTVADLKWFELFKDQKLQQLINDALANNYDLRQAVANIDAARASLGITRSEQFPQIIASGDVINQRQSRSSTVDVPEPIKRDPIIAATRLVRRA